MRRTITIVYAMLLCSLSATANAGGTIDPGRLPFPLNLPAVSAPGGTAAPTIPALGKFAPASPVAGRSPGAGRSPVAGRSPATGHTFLNKKPRSGAADPVTARARLEELRSGVDRFRSISRPGLRSGAGERLTSPEAVRQLSRLARDNGGSFAVAWQNDVASPRFMAGRDLLGEAAPVSRDPAVVAATFLKERRALFGVADPGSEFRAVRTETDAQGFQAVRFQQMCDGLEIWGHDIVVRLDPDLKVIGMSGFSRPTPTSFRPAASISRESAISAATTALGRRDGVAAVAADSRLVLFPSGDGGGLRTAWKVTVEAGLAYRVEAFVDARTGELLHDVSLVCEDGIASGSGADLSSVTRNLGLYQIGGNYFMIDTRKDMFVPEGSTFPDNPKGAIVVINAQNGKGDNLFHITSTNPASWTAYRNAISASYFAGQVYDYYKARHGRTSIDGAGGAMWLIVNFDQNYNNAFWNGQFMIFGNGNGTDFSDLAGALDVSAHEMSHGVIEKTAGLVYEFQSGALNEHFADAFGAATEFFVKGDQGNWLMGEDVTTPSIPNDALRNMENPGASNVALGGQQPASMDEFRNLTSDQDHGGVHINSGIPNRAFCLTAAAITIQKAERIWYRALTQYLVRNSQFVDFRLGTVRAAGDLFGAGSTEENAVKAAMDAVGITDGTGTSEPPPLPDNTGSDFLAVYDTGNGHILRVDPEFATTPEDISLIPMGPGGRPSFSDDGSVFAWVGSDGNIYGANSNGTGGFAFTTSGGWWSVALSPDKQYLAATTIAEDGQIYVFNLSSGEGAPINLGTQNSTDGEVPDVVVFADVMEFTADGQFLVYDALNRANLGGVDYVYWDINLLRLADSATFRVFPPMPRGQSVANPTLGQNHETRLAFDYLASDGHVHVVAVDFQSGNQGEIADNGLSDGRPTFSGDDTQVYYQRSTAEAKEIYRKSLDTSGVAGTGSEEAWATGGLVPVWFTIGTRPTPIELVALEGVWLDEEVTLNWQVTEPREFAGFAVSRAADPAGPWEVRTARLISTSSDGLSGGRFRFRDEAPAGIESWYRLAAVLRDGHTSILGRIRIERSTPGLHPAALNASPNPFRTTTRLSFQIPAGTRDVTLSVYDVSGRVAARILENAVLSPGDHVLEWTGRTASGQPLPVGEYFLRLATGTGGATTKILVVR